MSNTNDRYTEPTYPETHVQGAAGEPVLREHDGPEVHGPRDGDFVGQLEVTVKAPTTREADLLDELNAARDRIAELEALLNAE